MVSAAQLRVPPPLLAVPPSPPAVAGWTPCPLTSWLPFAGRRIAVLVCVHSGLAFFPLPWPPGPPLPLVVHLTPSAVPPAAMSPPPYQLIFSLLFAATLILGLVCARCWGASSLLPWTWVLLPPVAVLPPVPPAGLGWVLPRLAFLLLFSGRRTSWTAGVHV